MEYVFALAIIAFSYIAWRVYMVLTDEEVRQAVRAFKNEVKKAFKESYERNRKG